MNIFSYNNNKKSTTRIDTSLYGTRSQSFSAFKNRSQSISTIHHVFEETSPTATLTSSSSSYSLHHSSNHMTRSSHTDLSNTSSGSQSKRFHSSHLGRPPGSSNTRAFQKPPLSTSASTTALPRSNSTLKIAPMKEVEKMITDLKKENFDLKLRLYHLEDLMTKELDIYQMNEENNRLKMNLEDRNKYIDGLEGELSNLLDILEEKNKKAIGCSVGIQTEEVLFSPQDTSPTTGTDESYHTAFESSPEAFGLLPASASALSLFPPPTTTTINVKSKKKQMSNRKLSILGSWQKIKANDDHISSVVKALQKVKIDNNSNIMDTWLNQNVNDHQQGNLSYPIS